MYKTTYIGDIANHTIMINTEKTSRYVNITIIYISKLLYIVRLQDGMVTSLM